MNAYPFAATKPRPAPDSAGIPEHGARWGDGVVLRARSRGPGVAVEVEYPFGPDPRRVLTGAASMEARSGRVFLTPSQAAAGSEFFVTVEP